MLFARRDGIALAAVVVLMLAATLVAHALLVLSELEYRASRASARILIAELAARAVADRLASEPVPPALLGTPDGAVADSLPEVAGRALPGGTGPLAIRAAARRRRLSREIWLVEGRAVVGKWTRVELGRPVWQLDPALRIAEWPAVLTLSESGEVSAAGSVSTARPPSVTPVPGPGPACPALQAAVDSLRPGPPVATVASPVGPSTPILGLLSLDSLARRMPVVLSGVGTPTPSDPSGPCDTIDPWNWGSPEHPGEPCGAHRVAARLEDGVRIEGGVGQGIIILDGEALVTDLRFYGVVIARGRLALGGATRIEGRVIALDGLDMGPGTAIGGAVCHTGEALAHAALAVPSPIAGSGWLDGASR